MTLVQTREKLKPFVDNGVVHKDRKHEKKKKDEDDLFKRKKDEELEERICNYKAMIQDCIEEKKISELEKIVAKLTQEMQDTPENLYMQQCLRLNIIHAQICIGEFFKWKEKLKKKQVARAKKMFA